MQGRASRLAEQTEAELNEDRFLMHASWYDVRFLLTALADVERFALAAKAAGAAEERVKVEKRLKCRNGHPNYCPNCDNTITLPPAESAGKDQAR